MLNRLIKMFGSLVVYIVDCLVKSIRNVLRKDLMELASFFITMFRKRPKGVIRRSIGSAIEEGQALKDNPVT